MFKVGKLFALYVLAWSLALKKLYTFNLKL